MRLGKDGYFTDGMSDFSGLDKTEDLIFHCRVVDEHLLPGMKDNALVLMSPEEYVLLLFCQNEKGSASDFPLRSLF